MSFRVLLTPQAEEQLRVIDEWWQENRTAAPDLFVSIRQGCMNRIGAEAIVIWQPV